MNDLILDDLTCEFMTTPLGLGVTRPRLSWKLRSNRVGARQTAYRIVAGFREGESDLWDSDVVESDRSVLIEYGGQDLVSRQRVFWQVIVWDENGSPVESKTSWWEMGLLESADWAAQWISSRVTGTITDGAASPLLRRDFLIDQPVVSARAYVTALGLYELQLNGQRVGSNHFSPGWTDYSKRVQYQVYDVTPLINAGENTLGAILGDGWYCGHIGWKDRQVYGLKPQFLTQIEIELADGSKAVVTSDDQWTTSDSPIVSSDIMMGEEYDARLEMPGWCTTGFEEGDWEPVTLPETPNISISACLGPAVKVTEELCPIAEPTVGDQNGKAVWIYDLGQNMVGWARIVVKGKEGDTLQLRHAEILNADGTLYTDNLRKARATDRYTLKGDAAESWEPRFTFHGFRYVEVSGLSEPPLSLVGVVAHSDTPVIGSFQCSDPLVNQLQKNITWGQRCNFLEVPTDCPQRDERLGWTGDAQVFVRTASFNMQVSPFFHKWMRDMRDSQYENGALPCVVPAVDGILGFDGNGAPADGGPAWTDAAVICPWTIYQCYGDTTILRDNYPMMQKFVQYLERSSVDLIRSHPSLSGHLGFGDWLAQDGSDIFGRTPKDLIGTAFFAYCAELLSKIATVLEYHPDADAYQKLTDRVKEAFNKRFLTSDYLLIGQTQTAYVLALHFNLVPEAARPALTEALVSDIKQRGSKISSGFVGSSYTNLVLTQTGHLDVAYGLLAQKEWPSWLYAVTQGATTIWERWDGWTHDKGFQDVGMNSFNHYAYGAIGAWLYNTVAGIELDPDAPGYKHAILRPRPGGNLTSAAASLETGYGLLASRWTLTEGQIHWQATVPPNTTATAYVPTVAEYSPGIVPTGAEFKGVADGFAVYELVAGVYEFSSAV